MISRSKSQYLACNFCDIIEINLKKIYAPHITGTILHFNQKIEKCKIASSWRGVEMYICFLDGHMYS
jgi:hypothetical protein